MGTDVHLIAPPPRLDKKNLYLFGGSATFGYGLTDYQTVSYNLQELVSSEYRVTNLSKICNDITNLYCMVLAESPRGSTVIVDCGVYTEFMEDRYYKPSIYNYSFSPDYKKLMLEKILHFLTYRNNRVMLFQFCPTEMMDGIFVPIVYSDEYLLENDPSSTKHPNEAGSKRLASDLFKMMQNNSFITSFDDSVIQDFDKILDKNRQLNFSILQKSREYRRYISSLKSYKIDGKSGIIFLAANPLTKGHEHLIEYALQHVDVLYLATTESEALFFPTKIRLQMLSAAAMKYTVGGKQVIVLPTNPLKNSEITFAPYLHKKGSSISFVNEHILSFKMMEMLNIKYRFFGEEPDDAITKVYLDEFVKMSSCRGVTVSVIPRISGISSSACRNLIKVKDIEYKQLLSRDIISIVEYFLTELESDKI